jgi:hypothetical protein
LNVATDEAARRAERSRRLSAALVDVANHDRPAFGGDATGRGESDARRATGDNDTLAGEPAGQGAHTFCGFNSEMISAERS